MSNITLLDANENKRPLFNKNSHCIGSVVAYYTSAKNGNNGFFNYKMDFYKQYNYTLPCCFLDYLKMSFPSKKIAEICLASRARRIYGGRNSDEFYGFTYTDNMYKYCVKVNPVKLSFVVYFYKKEVVA